MIIFHYYILLLIFLSLENLLQKIVSYFYFFLFFWIKITCKLLCSINSAWRLFSSHSFSRSISISRSFAQLFSDTTVRNLIWLRFKAWLFQLPKAFPNLSKFFNLPQPFFFDCRLSFSFWFSAIPFFFPNNRVLFWICPSFATTRTLFLDCRLPFPSSFDLYILLLCELSSAFPFS